MDDADRADREIENERAEAIRRATAGLHPAESQQHGAGGAVICRACGRPIPPARLAVFPFAVRCVACQSEYEHEHQALGGAR